MFVFIKKYWHYLLLMLSGVVLSVSYFLSEKAWMGFVWLTMAMMWSVRLYQEHQKHRNKK